MATKFFKLHTPTAGPLPMYRIALRTWQTEDTDIFLDMADMGDAAEINHWCDLVSADVERIRQEALRAHAKHQARIERGDIPPLIVGPGAA